MIINKILTGIFINSLILYIFYKLYALWIYDGLQITIYVNDGGLGACEILVILGTILWVINDVVKHIIKLLALPFTFLFWWLILILINVALLYLFQLVVLQLDIEAMVKINSILDAIIISIVISLFNLIFKKL